MKWVRRLFAGMVALGVAAAFGAAAAAAAPAVQVSNGTYTVTSAGSDVYGSSDSFVYVYAPASGDGTWTVEINSEQNPVAWTKAGLMVRSNLTAGSPMLFFMNGYQNGNWLVDRTTQGGQVNTVTGGLNVATPVWVRLEKRGGQFFVFDSGNGTLWNLEGAPVSLNVGTNYYVGLAVTEHSPTAVGSVTFSNLSGFTPTAGQGIGVSGITTVNLGASASATSTTNSTASATTTSNTSNTSTSTTSTSSTSNTTTSTTSPSVLPKTGFPVGVARLVGLLLLAGSGLLLLRPRSRRPA